jgi:hypothetical protein
MLQLRNYLKIVTSPNYRELFVQIEEKFENGLDAEEMSLVGQCFMQTQTALTTLQSTQSQKYTQLLKHATEYVSQMFQYASKPPSPQQAPAVLDVEVDPSLGNIDDENDGYEDMDKDGTTNPAI